MLSNRLFVEIKFLASVADSTEQSACIGYLSFQIANDKG